MIILSQLTSSHIVTNTLNNVFLFLIWN